MLCIIVRFVISYSGECSDYSLLGCESVTLVQKYQCFRQVRRIFFYTDGGDSMSPPKFKDSG